MTLHGRKNMFTLRLPAPTGPHPVGIGTLHLVAPPG